MYNKSCMEFINILSSKAPVPGGGGASALVGAIGTALGAMVGNLTLGKKKYADVQDDIKNLLIKAESLQKDLLELINKDALAFEPLSKAYGLPKDTPEQQQYKAEVMENALKVASSVPYEIMEKCIEAIDLHEEMAQKGTKIALSDVGVGVAFCKSALMGASLNIYINTGLMKDRNYAIDLENKADALIEQGTKKADEVYNFVMSKIRKG